MVFSDSSWKDFPVNERSTGSYIVFYKGGTIHHVIYVPVPVPQSSSENDYNASCTAGMA